MKTVWMGLVLVVFGISACNGTGGFRTYCRQSSDCPAGFRCEASSGLCLCASNAVCRPDEFCDPTGDCRRRMSCETNRDCPTGLFCDSRTGNCLEDTKCTLDIQCPQGQICSELLFRCIPGCRITGDCPLGQICLAGECKSGLCQDKSYCAYGQLCDSNSQTCVDDIRGPFCNKCSAATIYQPNTCGGTGPNFCLVKAGDLTLPPYCGVDCSAGQSCPNGYDCFSVRIVYTDENCFEDSQCSSGRCYIREGDRKGFCLCSDSSQCPQDSCDETLGRCSITRRPCSPGGNECNRLICEGSRCFDRIPCIDGYCHIGFNCKPIEGLRCEDLRSGL